MLLAKVNHFRFHTHILLTFSLKMVQVLCHSDWRGGWDEGEQERKLCDTAKPVQWLLKAVVPFSIVMDAHLNPQ